ncbi:MAG: exosortase A [Methylomonas sp.]|nr:MAG: exosortase A [Methylomonas sp.]
MQTIDIIPLYWRKPLVLLLTVLVVFVLMFQDSWNSIVSIWSRSETFAHGYLVAPASLWLLWTRKDFYKQLCPQPSYLGCLGVLACGFIWLVADLAQVLVVNQFALVGMLLCLIWSLLGNKVTGSMLFPLFFLFLMVPFGEDFVPFLMEYTASFVVGMLHLTGVTVYREGLHFTLTSGNWSVVEACSGIRYLIASITLGLVYAYFNYSSYRKRVVFILASVLVPIVANGLRAYMIVMIGHLSSMKLATGVDHIVYGWVFFGLVMLLLFYIGSFWHDEAVSSMTKIDQTIPVEFPRYFSVTLGVVVFACFSVWPWVASELHAKQAVKAIIPETLLQKIPDEPALLPDWQWQPHFKGTVADKARFVEQDGAVLGIYIANFGDETQGGELVNSQNTLLSHEDKDWRLILNPSLAINWPAKVVKVEEVALKNDANDLLVLRWYRIGSVNTSNAYYAKWLQLRKRLTGDTTPELMIVLYTQASRGDYLLARERLQKIALACCSAN